MYLVSRDRAVASQSLGTSSCVWVPDRSCHFNGHWSLIEPKGPPTPPSRPPVPITRFSGFVVSCGNRNPAAHFSCTGAAAPLSFICALAFLCTQKIWWMRSILCWCLDVCNYGVLLCAVDRSSRVPVGGYQFRFPKTKTGTFYIKNDTVTIWWYRLWYPSCEQYLFPVYKRCW